MYVLVRASRLRDARDEPFASFVAILGQLTSESEIGDYVEASAD
jgi:hypothetical protein